MLNSLSSGFMPHGQCYLWESRLLWSHVISDLVIVIAYYSIPFFLFHLVKKRTDIQFSWVFSLFGLFILLCGSTHLIGIITVWYPVYWLSAIIKMATALVSISTAYLVWKFFPQILELPSPAQLKAVNQKLKKEITEHEHTELELNKFSLAIETSPDLVMITDNKGDIEYCNPAMYKATGYIKKEMVGANPLLFMPEFKSQFKFKRLWSTLNKGLSWQGELLDYKKNGETFWCLHSIAPIYDNQNNLTHFVSVAHDISERKQAEATISKLAYFDELTSLPNRSLFNERMEQAILNAKRNHSIFALIYLDLDHFKSINDSLGHLTGDKLLVEVGNRISQVLRENETVARLGGDEFAIILSSIDKPESASIVADKILKSLNQPLLIEYNELFISCSLGISIFPNDAKTKEMLSKDADTALYHAKDLGRNRFAFFNQQLETRNLRNLELEMGLRKAIQNQEFYILFQPKINSASHSLSGVETLIRWNSLKLGEVSPAEFIPIAEQSGLIDQIGSWVLLNVCRQIQNWKKNDRFATPVSINLSARQFKQETQLLSMLDQLLQQYQIQPELLQFEITESAIMDDPEKSLQFMNRFKQRKIKLAIDDFGTGYSSLDYLKKFPVSILKIDRSFVSDIAIDQDDEAIISAIISLAHNLGLTVIAEGVETEQQLEFLLHHHCDEIQGFYFHPPISAKNLVECYGIQSLPNKTNTTNK